MSKSKSRKPSPDVPQPRRGAGVLDDSGQKVGGRWGNKPMADDSDLISAALGGDTFASDDGDSPMVEASLGGRNILLQQINGEEWQYLPSLIGTDIGAGILGTALSDSDEVAEKYEAEVRCALIGGSVAQTLNDGLVEPGDMELLMAHIDSLLNGTEIEIDPPEGTIAAAWEGVALRTVNRVGADLERRWDEAGDELPGGSDLLSDTFFERDPLRNDDSEEYVDTCVERAMRAIAGGDHVVKEHFPLETIVCDALANAPDDDPDVAGLNSPAYIAEVTGLGGRVGDLGICYDMYEAHKKAGTGVYVNGVIVVSAAHRLGADSDAFRQWVTENIVVGDDLPATSAEAESKPHAVGCVLDNVIYGAPDADVAMAALDVIADVAGDEFDAGVQEFYAWGMESNEEMEEPFRDDPDMHSKVRGSMDKYLEMVNDCPELEELLAQYSK